MAELYHPKVSVLPFTNDVASIQSRLDLLVPPTFGVGAAIRGYLQMMFGSGFINAGIERLQFKPVYIPTWLVDSVLSFTSRAGDGDHGTSMHIRGGIVPGSHLHPLAQWIPRLEIESDDLEPFSERYLEPLEGHEILALPFTTNPLAIPKVLSRAPLGNVEVSEGWSIDPRSVQFQMLVAYPILHPVYLAEFAMEDARITILAHGHYDCFSLWGHHRYPNKWVNSGSLPIVAYLRSTQPLSGAPKAIVDLLYGYNTTDNLENIVESVDMDELRIQPFSSADDTRHWMTTVSKTDGLKFVMDNIPANTDASIIKIGPGFRGSRSRVNAEDARAPLQRQVRELEAEMEQSRPEWLVKLDESSRDAKSPDKYPKQDKKRVDT